MLRVDIEWSMDVNKYRKKVKINKDKEHDEEDKKWK